MHCSVTINQDALEIDCTDYIVITVCSSSVQTCDATVATIGTVGAALLSSVNHDCNSCEIVAQGTR